jgi:hypothetical protein
VNDRPVSPLLVTAGALAGGALAIALSSAQPLTQLAQAAFGGKLDPTAAATGIAGLLARMVLPIAAAAMIGALAVGLVQSRRISLRAGEPDRDARAIPWALAAAVGVLTVWAARAVAPSLARAEGLAAALSASADALTRLAPRVVLLFAAAGLADFALRRMRELPRREEREGPDPRLAAEWRRRQRQ